ncbi:hypothetical protein XELAEV_18042063mg [Xenopus laevis]|uniref:Uncharacterized protein n=1 Tax=Xenopus laevis TaxID=8355 RepID=A0A974C3F8_XENLA|nr:hypothetical protein XELAEV_18042063mg [Xenopus laevis]
MMGPVYSGKAVIILQFVEGPCRACGEPAPPVQESGQGEGAVNITLDPVYSGKYKPRHLPASCKAYPPL